MLRKILAVVLGLVVGSAVNMALIMVSMALYPLPDGATEVTDANDMALGALLIVLAAHAGGSLASGLVCGFIAKRVWLAAGIGLGILWTCAGVSMLFAIPSPLWFAIADTASYIPAAILGVLVGGNLAKPVQTDA